MMHDLFLVGGMAAITVGLYQIGQPYAFIFAGLAVAILSVLHKIASGEGTTDDS